MTSVLCMNGENLYDWKLRKRRIMKVSERVRVEERDLADSSFYQFSTPEITVMSPLLLGSHITVSTPLMFTCFVCPGPFSSVFKPQMGEEESLRNLREASRSAIDTPDNLCISSDYKSASVFLLSRNCESSQAP